MANGLESEMNTDYDVIVIGGGEWLQQPTLAYLAALKALHREIATSRQLAGVAS